MPSFSRAEAPAEPPPESSRLEERALDSRALFGESREVLIEHHGEQYRLRLTRAGKLILTK